MAYSPDEPDELEMPKLDPGDGIVLRYNVFARGRQYRPQIVPMETSCNRCRLYRDGCECFSDIYYPDGEACECPDILIYKDSKPYDCVERGLGPPLHRDFVTYGVVWVRVEEYLEPVYVRPGGGKWRRMGFKDASGIILDRVL